MYKLEALYFKTDYKDSQIHHSEHVHKSSGFEFEFITEQYFDKGIDRKILRPSNCIRINAIHPAFEYFSNTRRRHTCIIHFPLSFLSTSCAGTFSNDIIANLTPYLYPMRLDIYLCIDLIQLFDPSLFVPGIRTNTTSRRRCWRLRGRETGSGPLSGMNTTRFTRSIWRLVSWGNVALGCRWGRLWREQY